MKIQKLIEELTKIKDKDPEKVVYIEVFDIKQSRITRGWLFDLAIDNAEEHVKLRQNRCVGWNLYTESTKEIQEIETSLCGEE